MSKAISTQSNKTGRGCLIAFFSVFALFGFGFLTVFIFVVYNVWAARNWTETPCVVLESKVKTHQGDDGNTYSIFVKYEYFVDGKKHVSDRYHFSIGSSSGYKGKQKVVNELPPGTEAVCYVNPQDPADAVMNRGLGWEFLFVLLPLIFIVVGVGGILFAIFGKSNNRGKSWKPEPKQSRSDPLTVKYGEGVTLKPTSTPLVTFLFLLFFALIWNGIICIPLFTEVIPGFAQGRPRWFLSLFLVPFVVIGLVVIGLTFYQFLAIFNPRPVLKLARIPLQLGETAHLDWEFSRATSAVRSLKITLVGLEKATYRQGTDLKTDDRKFHTTPLVKASTGREMIGGKIEFTIPADSMHSFESEHNRIIWQFHVKGDVAWWPDIDEQYEVVVVPPGYEEG